MCHPASLRFSIPHPLCFCGMSDFLHMPCRARLCLCTPVCTSQAGLTHAPTVLSWGIRWNARVQGTADLHNLGALCQDMRICGVPELWGMAVCPWNLDKYRETWDCAWAWLSHGENDVLSRMERPYLRQWCFTLLTYTHTHKIKSLQVFLLNFISFPQKFENRSDEWLISHRHFFSGEEVSNLCDIFNLINTQLVLNTKLTNQISLM